MVEGYIFYIATGLVLMITAIMMLLPDFRYKKASVVSTFVGLLVLIFFAFANLTGHPRPVYVMMVKPDVDIASVEAYHLKKDEYIMLLLKWDDIPYPLYFKFPWDKKRAEELLKAERDSKALGAPGMLVERPFEKSLEQRKSPWAHPTPIPKMQHDKENEPEILEYEHPSQGA